MATTRISESKANDVAETDPKVSEPDTVEERRARRMRALRKVAGLWADRDDIPSDALEYQRATRAEWR